MILLFALALSPAWEAPRIEAALYVSAVAWGHDPATFRALAVVESSLDANPRRAITGPLRGKRWGKRKTKTTHPFRVCSLLQLRGGLAASDGSTIPLCELLVLSPALSAWWGALHLAGYRERCGVRRAVETYNVGHCVEPGSFAAKVRRYRRAR